MKLFFIKTAVFLFILAAILISSDLLVPYYWGNNGLCAKMAVWKKQSGRYNTCFFGSSATYRHIIPSLFDESAKTKSFNFGYLGMYNPEMYSFYEHFLEGDIGSLEYVIMELQVIRNIPKKNLHTKRTKYFLDYDNYSFALDYIRSSANIDDDEKNEMIKNFRTSYLENLFKIGILQDAVRYALMPPEIDYKILGDKKDGYYSLENNMRDSGEDSSYKKRYEEFHEDTSELDRMFEETESIYSRSDIPGLNTAHIKKIETLIEASRARGIRLIFFLPPRVEKDYLMELLPILRMLDEKHRIDTGDPFEYSEFYHASNSFDLWHLNAEGAKQYTIVLAEKFNSLTDSEYKSFAMNP